VGRGELGWLPVFIPDLEISLVYGNACNAPFVATEKNSIFNVLYLQLSMQCPFEPYENH